MPDKFLPILKIDSFNLADDYRTRLNRMPGSCSVLQNTAPIYTGGERIRYGYDNYSNVNIKTFAGVAGSVVTTTLTITGSDALGLSVVNDYYNDYTLYNYTMQDSATISDYGYSAADGGTSTFTLSKNIQTAGWAVTDDYAICVAGDIYLPQGTEIVKVLGIQNPVQEDVFLFFANQSGTEKVFMTPWWLGENKRTTNHLLTENSHHDLTGATITIENNTLSIQNASDYGLSTQNDYYNGWIIENPMHDYELVVDYLHTTGGTAVFQLIRDIDTGGLDWSEITEFYLWKHAHGVRINNPDWINPMNYNTDLQNPTEASVKDSVIRFSGGASSDTNVRSCIIFPYIKRTFFPYLEAPYKYTIEGTYVSEQRLRALTRGSFIQSGDSSPINTLSNLVSTFGVVSAVSIVEDGSGYSVGDELTLTGGDNNCKVKITVLGTPGPYGKKQKVVITANGSGYIAGVTHNVTGGGGSGATIKVESATISDALKYLPYNSTYWVAIAPIYDGYQLGELLRFEDINNDYHDSGDAGDAWANNYIKPSHTAWIDLFFQYLPHLWDKRITGFRIYMAIDDGDTRVSGRKALYKFVNEISFIEENPATKHAFSGGTSPNCYSIVLEIKSEPTGNVYVTDSGMSEIQTDTMYSYSMDRFIGGRRFLSNVYVDSEAGYDREKLFTNPISAVYGLPQPDLFPNDGLYRLPTEVTVGKRITGLEQTGMEEVLVWKDRGVLHGRTYDTVAGQIDFMWNVLSREVGSCTLNQVVKADDGSYYFAGYEDFYQLEGGRINKLIERADKNDWLYNYRSKTNQQKENAILWYLPDNVIYIQFYYGAAMFVFYPPENNIDGVSKNWGWRNVLYEGGTIHWECLARLQGGDVLGLRHKGGDKALMIFGNSQADRHYWKDDTVDIVYRIATGYFMPTGNLETDFVLNKIITNRYRTVNTIGELQYKLDRENYTVRTYENVTKSEDRLEIHSYTEDPRIGNIWRLLINYGDDPEVLDGGGTIQIHSLEFWGDVIPREKRADYAGGEGTTVTYPDDPIGTINGLREFLIVSPNTWESFTWDEPFSKEYASLDGTTRPYYRILPQDARSGTGLAMDTNEIMFKDETITGFKARSPEANTLVKYAIG